MHDIDEDVPTPSAPSLLGWRRAIGIAALVAAAGASILFATPAMPEPPATEGACQMDLLAGRWSGDCAPDPDAVAR